MPVKLLPGHFQVIVTGQRLINEEFPSKIHVNYRAKRGIQQNR